MKSLLDEQYKTGVPGYLVAVKMAKEDAADEVIEEMRVEAAIMAQFSHPNVVGLIGQVTEDGLFLIVEQYCEHGALLSWLIDHGPAASMRTLLNMCLDVSAGMTYLTSLGVVHRDLAARNVLLSSELTCKVSDFGLSRHAVEGVVVTAAKDQVATRWAAPEAISDHRFTDKSDVWSYGVLLFEVFSFGDKPYDTWSNRRVWEEVRRGYRLPKPRSCPDEIYDLMMQMWHADPEQRPDFEILQAELQFLAETMVVEEEAGPIITNKLVARFNETKRAIMSSANTSGNGDDDGPAHETHSVQRRPRNRGSSKSVQSGCSVQSHGHESHHLNLPKRSRGHSIKYSQPSFASTMRSRSNTVKSNTRVHSYLALVGGNGNMIAAEQEMPSVPPVFQSIVEHVAAAELPKGREFVVTIAVTDQPLAAPDVDDEARSSSETGQHAEQGIDKRL